MSQYGTVEETVSFGDINCNTPTAFSLELISFPRSSTITSLYQFYRLKYLKVDYQPKYPLGLSAPAVPSLSNVGRPMRLYYIMNRQGTIPNGLDLNDFLQKGCRPIPFGTSSSRSVVVKYVPNLTDALNTTGPQSGDGTAVNAQAITPIFKKWVNRYYTTAGADTSNDTVEWQGHFTWIDDYNNVADTATAVAEVRITACWEYKNPYTPQLTPPMGKPELVKATPEIK